MKESDITAFLLGHVRNQNYYFGDWPIDWSYHDDEHKYNIHNYNHSSYIIYYVKTEAAASRIHNKSGQYTEREALEIMAKHWKENEHRS